VEPSDDRGAGDNSLTGVACPSTNYCEAVGQYANGSRTAPLIESWDGSAWRLDKGASGTTGGSTLTGIACISESSCTAVGSYNDNYVSKTLVESWNGSKWSIMSSPNEDNKYAEQLNGIDCAKVSFCTAVGSYDTSKGVERTLVETWNGKKWSIVKSPNDAKKDNVLASVDCPKVDDCIAVGSYRTSDEVVQPLAESWNGSRWTIVPSPAGSGGYNALYGLSCVNGSSCTAVGVSDAGVDQTLIEAFDGSEWSTVSSPNEGTLGDSLSGVSCSSASSCTAVGTVVTGPEYSTDTFAEQESGGTVKRS
jgi:hypothetical protein